MKKLLKHHKTKMAQKRVVGKTLNLLINGFLIVIFCGIINILIINYGSFAKQVFETHNIVMDCNDMTEFIEEYPESTLNKESIKKCSSLGLI